MAEAPARALVRTMRPLHVWALGVGLVISGEYFGWNYGWPVAGTLGFLVSTLLVTVLYTTFVFSFTELTTAIPDAGGAFAYGGRAFGRFGALVAGTASLVEFLFAPPAIAFALGGYLHVIAPALPITGAAMAALVAFGGLNLFGVHQSARLELVITLVAVAELCVFIALVLPHFQLERFTRDGFIGGPAGVFAALPFAIWLFLGIEGVAMAAEEVVEPSRHLPVGYVTAIVTLVALALGVMVAAGGVGDWRALTTTDYPIPGAVQLALGGASSWARVFAGIGLFGLLASLNGILFSASRQLYAVARAGLLPPGLTALNRHATPHVAVVACTAIGLVALASGKTQELIVLSGMGAVVLYIVSMASLFALRRREPALARPFRAPFYPLFPALALVLSVAGLAAMAWSTPGLALLFAALMAAGMAYGVRASGPGGGPQTRPLPHPTAPR